MPYTVKSGDSLNKIAAANGMTLSELLALNPHFQSNPDLIHPGQVVALPSDGDGGGDGEGGGGDPNNPDPETTMEVLQGADMQWFKDGETWYLSYGLPGSDRRIFYEADKDQMDALFGEGNRPDDFTTTTFKNLSRREGSVFGGNISEMEGDGSFENEVEKVLQLALDEGKLPTWMEGNPEVYDILYTAQAEGKSSEWIIEQVSTTTAFQTRFGGGVQEYADANNLSLVDAIDDFLNYETELKNLEKQFGNNPDAVTAADVGGLMNAGYTVDQVKNVYGRFEHMRKNEDALNAFNSVLMANDMEGLTLQGAYDFMLGNAPQDLYDIWEASSITEMAVAGGFAEYLDPSVALDFAYSTPGMIDEAQINQFSQKAAADLLRFRHEVDMGKFGLSHEDLVDAAFGMTPRSGATIAEVQDMVSRASAEAAGELNSRAFAPFRNFNDPAHPTSSFTGPATR